MSNKKIIITISALCFVIVLAIGYAAFTGQLNISGSGDVKGSSWQIYLDENSITTGHTGTATVNTPSVSNNNATALNNYTATVSSPNDSITVQMTVKNDSDYDAVLSDFTIGTPSCTVSGVDPDNSAGKVCSKLSYTIRYLDGSQLIEGTDILASKSQATFVITLTYQNMTSGSELPSVNVSISNLGVSLTYAQSSNYVKLNTVTLKTEVGTYSNNQKTIDISLRENQTIPFETPQNYEEQYAGYTFKGWCLESNYDSVNKVCTSSLFDTSTAVNNDISLYAVINSQVE